MNDEQAQARQAKYPHLSLKAIAYTAGRGAAFDRADGLPAEDCRNEFTAPDLRQWFEDGARSARAEIRLDRDTEWD